jgi:hypothetical protein
MVATPDSSTGRSFVRVKRAVSARVISSTSFSTAALLRGTEVKVESKEPRVSESSIDCDDDKDEGYGEKRKGGGEEYDIGDETDRDDTQRDVPGAGVSLDGPKKTRQQLNREKRMRQRARDKCRAKQDREEIRREEAAFKDTRPGVRLGLLCSGVGCSRRPNSDDLACNMQPFRCRRRLCSKCHKLQRNARQAPDGGDGSVREWIIDTNGADRKPVFICPEHRVMFRRSPVPLGNTFFFFLFSRLVCKHLPSLFSS